MFLLFPGCSLAKFVCAVAFAVGCSINFISPSAPLDSPYVLLLSFSALQPPVGPLLAMAKPVLELADGTLPVTALSWSSDETHEWIAAGRVDGSIAFYNLTSKGQTSPNQTRLVVPEFVVTTNNVISRIGLPAFYFALGPCFARSLLETTKLTRYTLIQILGLLHQNPSFLP